MIKPKSGFVKAELDSEKLTTRQWKGIMYAMDNYAEHYHQEKMKQHDALVKMMAQDEKEGNYEQDDKCECNTKEEIADCIYRCHRFDD